MLLRLRLTLQQHRFEVLASVVLCLGVAIAVVIEALRLNSVMVPAGCDLTAYSGPDSSVSAACREASTAWMSIRDGFEMNLLAPLPQVMLFVVGLLLGAPLVAREIENGTAPLSWALAGSRRRWLAPRMLTMVALIVPLMLVVGLASDFLVSATSRGLNPWADFNSFTSRDVLLVFWGIAAFAGTVALGTLLGRTLPAILLAMVVCLFVRGSWDAVMNRTVLPPLSQALSAPAEIESGLTGNVDWSSLVVYQDMYKDGVPWSGDVNAWFEAHMVNTTDANGIVTSTWPTMDPRKIPYSVFFGIPGNCYWPIVALESGILLAGSMFCGAVALFWVGRRRPY
jgi:hypothetical protein